MRPMLAFAAGAAAVLAATGCSGEPARQVAPAPTVSLTLRPSAGLTLAPSPGDVAATKQVCAYAAAAATDLTKFFNDEIAAIEAAAAKGDQPGMVGAAKIIQDKFVTLSSSLTSLSRRPVDSDVKVALTNAAAALKEITSESYRGSTQDTQTKLSNLAIVFAKACG
jgi:hypothetical protein